MVKLGVTSKVSQTFGNQLICAVEQAPVAEPGKTRTETGLERCWQEFPEAIFAIGYAPTALLALCDRVKSATIQLALVIGTPVGFVSVLEAKSALAQTPVLQILVTGRKGGSPVAAAILNALIVLAWEEALASP